MGESCLNGRMGWLHSLRGHLAFYRFVTTKESDGARKILLNTTGSSVSRSGYYSFAFSYCSFNDLKLEGRS